MAKKPIPKRSERLQEHPAVTENRALQLSDMDVHGQAMAEQRWKDMGKAKTNTRNALKSTKERLALGDKPIEEGGKPLSDDRRKILNKNKGNYEAVLKNNLVENVPLNIEDAATRRVDLFDQGVQRHSREGDIRTGAEPSVQPLSAGWYIDHARDIHEIADRLGFDREVLYSASGAMSPQNSPDNEKKALAAIASAEKANHAVTATTLTGARALGIEIPSHIKSDKDFQKLHATQRTRQFKDLTPDQIRAGLGKGEMRSHVDTKADIEGFAAGGTGLTRGIDIIRGNLGVDDFLAEGPNGGPKVASYVENIRNAGRSNANEKSEYFRRMHNAVEGAKPYFEQPTLFGEEWEKDPYGKAGSTEGTLNPRGSTAEDTWMRAISARQPKEFEEIPTGTESGRVGKFVGSDPSLQKLSVTGIYPTVPEHPNAKSETIIHAMNNAATTRAAGMLTDRARDAGRDVGAGVPNMGVQETSWSEYRIQAGKDPAYEKASRNSIFHGTHQAHRPDPNQLSFDI